MNTHVVDSSKHELVNIAVDRSINIFALVRHSLHISGSETEGRRKTKKFDEKDEAFVCMCFSFGLPILQRLDIILVTNIEFLLFVPAACGCEGSWKMDMFRKKPDPKGMW